MCTWSVCAYIVYPYIKSLVQQESLEPGLVQVALVSDRWRGLIDLNQPSPPGSYFDEHVHKLVLLIDKKEL